MSFRRRTFPEVLDYLLTSITGGVAAEAHPFPPPGVSRPPFSHSLLQPPVGDVISVYGSRDGQPHLFRADADYKLAPDRQTLQWQKAAQLPDEGTLVLVNYYPQSAQPVVTDIQTGSVVRTLAETVALEMARLYAQLQAVYDAGFIDSATGQSLDRVVALLGIERVRGGRAAGAVEFTRSTGARGAISIPAGTRIITPDGNVEYETTGPVTMSTGQSAVRVVARDLEINDPLPADSLTVLPVPIAGVAGVTNPAPTSIATQDETDAELRARAKTFLYGSERATLGAISQAIVRQGLTADVHEDPNTPGLVTITPHAEAVPPELKERLLAAIKDSRPAGVRVVLKDAEPPRKVHLDLLLTTASGLLEQDLRGAQRAAREKLSDYFVRLPAREPASLNKLVGLVLSVPGIEDVRVLSARWSHDSTTEDVLDRQAGLLKTSGFPTALGDLHIADPNLPSLLSVVITHPEGEAPPDVPAVKSALSAAVSYLNTVNASELPAGAGNAQKAQRELSFGKLLRVTPLPNKPAASLEAYDATASAGSAPALPSGASPYHVQFVITQASGLSRVLSAPADKYTLAPFERLSLADVEAQPEATA